MDSSNQFEKIMFYHFDYSVDYKLYFKGEILGANNYNVSVVLFKSKGSDFDGSVHSSTQLLGSIQMTITTRNAARKKYQLRFLLVSLNCQWHLKNALTLTVGP